MHKDKPELCTLLGNRLKGSTVPFNIHILFLQGRVGHQGHEHRVVADGGASALVFFVDLLLLIGLKALIVLWSKAR